MLPSPAPLILFGAFDRHNFGDLLLARVAARLAAMEFPGRPLVWAGVAERNLEPWGGFSTRAIADLTRHWGDRPADVLYLGGELLSCSLYEAAVMVLAPDEAEAAIARYDSDGLARQSWAQAQLHLDQQLAYLVPKALFRHPGRFVHRALGGVDLAALPPAMQAEALARLAESDSLTVRDRVTRDWLADRGIQAALEPDPGERVAGLFGDVIARHGEVGEPAEVGQAFPRGYVAVQFSADFGDDAALDSLATGLDAALVGSELGLVLFRAGAAPWHDDAAVYRRLMDRLHTRRVRLFDSLHLWDICALLARARCYCGSSLHGRIVSRAFGVPGVSLMRQATPAPGKVQAYAQTWWGPGEGPVLPSGLGTALVVALGQ